MTREELMQNDGRDGRPAHVAVNGKVYDFSGSPRWVNGNHESFHQAGRDLTEALRTAPHVRAVIERFPVVGDLEEPQPTVNPGIGRWLTVALVLASLVFILYWLLR